MTPEELVRLAQSNKEQREMRAQQSYEIVDYILDQERIDEDDFLQEQARNLWEDDLDVINRIKDYDQDAYESDVNSWFKAGMSRSSWLDKIHDSNIAWKYGEDGRKHDLSDHDKHLRKLEDTMEVMVTRFLQDGVEPDERVTREFEVLNASIKLMESVEKDGQLPRW